MKKRKIREFNDKVRIENNNISEMLGSTYMCKNISAHNVVEELKRFLDENFKGSYIDENIVNSRKYAIVYPYQLAFFLRVIFRSAWGQKVIRVKSFIRDDTLVTELQFDTSKITEDELEHLVEAAKQGEFTMALSDDKIEIIHELFETDDVTVCEKRITFVYNILSSTFNIFRFF